MEIIVLTGLEVDARITWIFLTYHVTDRVSKGVILWMLLRLYENDIEVIRRETMATNSSHVTSSYVNLSPYIDLPWDNE